MQLDDDAVKTAVNRLHRAEGQLAGGLTQCLAEGGPDSDLDVAEMEKLFLSLA